MSRRAPQLSFALAAPPTWGGNRPNAGRKPNGERAGVSHGAREELNGAAPVHATLRVLPHVWNLRSRRSYRVIEAALEGVRGRSDFRVVHFSIQGNHLHLISEAESSRALADGVKALSVRIAKRLNRMMGRRGTVFSDRYHVHVLRTPTEVQNALAYVLGNFASHARRRGERVGGAFVDPFSSAAPATPEGGPVPVQRPRTWLLRQHLHPVHRTPAAHDVDGTQR